MRLLLVEDDPELAPAIAAGLREHDFAVRSAADYGQGTRLAREGEFDVIILDVMLPGGSGFELCRELRADGIATPILMLTARDALDDRVTGLDVGADDYLTKPYAFPELLARVRALARRRRDLEPATIEIADLVVDLQRRRVTRAGKAVELTAKEFALLACFVEHRDRVIDRAVITAYVWDENHDPFTNVLEVLVRRLRRKIDDGFEPKLIHTFRGAGYRLGV
ncbi:MAG TPA: response regulator transcription factor [Gemmatimonadales bacterium]|jgi:two-component system copper resistance phosphate regulon response regulator CusR